MSRLSRLVPIVGGAVAGGAIALVVATGSGGTTHSVTTETVTQQAGSAAVPTALSTSNGLTINQIYRAASLGVVDITVSTNEGAAATSSVAVAAADSSRRPARAPVSCTT